MKKLFKLIAKELIIKFDIENNEYELGWIWVIAAMIIAYPHIRNIIISIM